MILSLVRKIKFVFFLIISLAASSLQAGKVPFVGAQVFIEPGQTEEYIDRLFQVMSENGMSMCRIRMFESYMRTPAGGWDFSLFDHAFDAASRHGVKIYCTFFPATDKLDIGGWKFPYDELQWIAFKDYIRSLTLHYKDHSALAGWVLINEPGIGQNFSYTPFLETERQKWEFENPQKEFTDKGYPILMNTREQEFVNHVTTKFLNDIATEIKRYDTSHDIHVNPAGVFSNYGEYDFPAWRRFLTSLGGSAHPSWHFGDYRRNEYTLAMLALSEMLRSGAGDMPWFMTEIQGGNNTYSGEKAFCPTPAEITQWLWTIIGCEGKGGIFWMLNPRVAGIEAGEWGLLNYQNKPSARMKAAGVVADIIRSHADVFENVREIPSGIDVVYLREALWAENRVAKAKDDFEGRRYGAVFKSATACFRALSERGLNVGLKEFHEYDFTQHDYTGKTIILANQIALPSKYFAQFEYFVKNGGTLVIEGLTGYFDVNLLAQVVTGSPFAELFGDEISEVILKGELFNVKDADLELPSHLWYGMFADNTADCLVNEIGKGKVVWIPSNIALGARVSDDYEPLSDFLFGKSATDYEPIGFDKYYRGLLLRTLETDKGRLFICTSNSNREETPVLAELDDEVSPKILYASENCSIVGNRLNLPPGGTCVFLITR